MTTLDKIRAEIENDTNRYQFQGYGIDTYLKIDDVLAVIDKYAEQEPSEEWQNGYDMAWEEAKVFYEVQECEDAVSRQAAIDALMKSADAHAENEREWQLLLRDRNIIRELPSVQPKQKTGRWIDHDKYIECDSCKIWYLKDHLIRKSFCPNCGAKMVEQKESEEKV